ncbi:Glycoside hydrolase family 1 protein [Mycena venus]|uniref:Glycoside hydrolase family 1 protein n=1 Tax=Mycena venus TaxID=2733690 RepID=A0A8H6Z1N6_9AGAR|nr:Glycoside hydrolase family 1 protein [Mycena venus]
MARMDLKLTVRIQYAHWKAVHLMDVEKMDPHRMAQILRADLDRFKLPHPPVAKIQSPTEDGIQFSYDTHEGSPLFVAVLRAFEIRYVANERTFIMRNTSEICSLKIACSIEHMTMEETDEWNRRPRGVRRARSFSPANKYRRARSPSPSVNNWRRVDRKPLARHNGSSDRWIKYGSPDKRSKLDENHVDAVSDSASERNVPYKEAVIPQGQAAAVARLTREYWDTRRDLSNAAAQGMFVQSQLARLGGDIDGSSGASDLNFSEQIRELEQTLESERSKLQTAEKALGDVLRECETPVIVPELLKLVEMCAMEMGSM